MATDPAQMEHLAQMVRVALQTADLASYRELLDPQVSWGPPDDVVSGCHNRDEVLEWYQLARDRGMRADVIETIVKGDKILVGLMVHPPSRTKDGDALRWQILSVVDGRVKDIRGFDDREDAVSRMV